MRMLGRILLFILLAIQLSSCSSLSFSERAPASASYAPPGCHGLLLSFIDRKILHGPVVDEDLMPGQQNHVYILEDEWENLGLFKPKDYEVGGIHNPVNRGPGPTNNFINPFYPVAQGEQYKREVATSIVDNYLDLDLVPHTMFFTHEEYGLGSLQEFKKWNQTMAVFQQPYEKVLAEHATEDEIQRLIVLDLITGQLDRHMKNILFDTRQNRVHAIDHGLSFPEGPAMPLPGDNLFFDQFLHEFERPLPEALRDKVLSIRINDLLMAIQGAADLNQVALERTRLRIETLQDLLKRSPNIPISTLITEIKKLMYH